MFSTLNHSNSILTKIKDALTPPKTNLEFGFTQDYFGNLAGDGLHFTIKVNGIEFDCIVTIQAMKQLGYQFRTECIYEFAIQRGMDLQSIALQEILNSKQATSPIILDNKDILKHIYLHQQQDLALEHVCALREPDKAKSH